MRDLHPPWKRYSELWRSDCVFLGTWSPELEPSAGDRRGLGGSTTRPRTAQSDTWAEYRKHYRHSTLLHAVWWERLRPQALERKQRVVHSNPKPSTDLPGRRQIPMMTLHTSPHILRSCTRCCEGFMIREGKKVGSTAPCCMSARHLWHNMSPVKSVMASFKANCVK